MLVGFAIYFFYGSQRSRLGTNSATIAYKPMANHDDSDEGEGNVRLMTGPTSADGSDSEHTMITAPRLPRTGSEESIALSDGADEEGMANTTGAGPASSTA
jgi:hypothetical protein